MSAEAEADARAIAAHHGLAGAEVTRFAAGSVPVYAVGPAHVLKLFPAAEEAFWRTEVTALQAAQGRLPVATPGVHAAARSGAWRYILMDRLPGQPLDGVWGDLPPAARADLMDQVGQLLGALHALPVAALGAITPDWAAFVAGQRAGCVARQAQYKLTTPWLEQVAPFLDAVALSAPAAPALLHTEVMHAHLLVTPAAEGWRLSGLVDFEPAMVGDPEYELASVGVFVSCGDPALFQRVLDGMGVPAAARVGLARRVMAWMLLHRYSRLTWYLERLPPPPGVESLDALAEAWLGA
jgi:hygromycin-B 7''-O-kinase